MRAVDTNVLVRLITRDDARQMSSAEAFVAKGAWVPHLVLAESLWVLSSVYGLGPREIAAAVEMLLHHRHLTIEDSDLVELALGQYRKKPSIGFSDCLVLEIARRAGHLPVGTFDRSFGKLDGVQQL